MAVAVDFQLADIVLAADIMLAYTILATIFVLAYTVLAVAVDIKLAYIVRCQNLPVSKNFLSDE